MFSIAKKFLFSRMKWFVLMVISLTVIISTILSIFTAGEAIRNGLLQKAYTQYGEHSGILLESKKSKQELEQDFSVVGEFEVVDVFSPPNNDRDVSIGWMDQEARTLGKINILEGRFPKETNEVAVESAYLHFIDPDWKIGETKRLNGENEHWELKLVGVLSNYSAKWYTPFKSEQNYMYPNLFIHPLTHKGDDRDKNFLLKIKSHEDKSVEKLESYLFNYEEDAFLNEKLLMEGLRNYKTIAYLSTIFQFILLITSMFCMITLFSFFHKRQIEKIAALKAIGYKNNSFYRLYFYQCVIIFFTSLLGVLPIQYALNNLIIRTTISDGILKYTYHTYFSVIGFLLVLFLLFLVIAWWPIRQVKSKSVKELMSFNSRESPFYHALAKYLRTFSAKQLMRQLCLYPKQFAYIITILSMSILVFVFSIFYQKESEGIGEIEEHYYLEAQEIYGFDTVNELPILLKQGLTFSKSDVSELETTLGVKFISKIPFMVDVFPVFKTGQQVNSLNDKEKTYYEDQLVIHNIQYKVINEEEFKQMYPEGNYNDFQGKMILFIPSIDNDISDSDNLIGQKVSLIKQLKQNNQIEKVEENYEVYNIFNRRFVEKMANMEEQADDEMTIVFAEETLENSKLFPGYIELKVYLDSNVNSHQVQTIDDKINQLIATTPGSLLQNIPELIQQETKIPSLLGFLAKYTFVITSFLIILSIIIIVYGKYLLQKKSWGVYLAMGMSKKRMYSFLVKELLIYWIVSSVVSFIIFILFLLQSDFIYPITLYLLYFVLAIVIIGFLLMVGSFILYKMMIKQSIFSILRENE